MLFLSMLRPNLVLTLGFSSFSAAFLCWHHCQASCRLLGVAMLAVSDRGVLSLFCFEGCWGTLKRERKPCSACPLVFRTFHVHVTPAAVAPGCTHHAYLYWLMNKYSQLREKKPVEMQLTLNSYQNFFFLFILDNVIRSELPALFLFTKTCLFF